MSTLGDIPVSANRTRWIIWLALGGSMLGCTGRRPADLGIRDGRLRLCPGSPNCVTSETGATPTEAVRPLAAPAGPADLVRLAELVRAWPRASVISVTPEYIHAEFTSRIMRFVDDVEFRLDATAQVIHVRSASRLGRSDLGVNRKRVEALRQRWEGSVSPAGSTPPR
jgi:uncharacterized protein (DUF1499 family)